MTDFMLVVKPLKSPSQTFENSTQLIDNLWK